MKHYGADDRTSQFFKSFFTDRSLYTEWKGVSSEPVKMYNHSCVQGSCLGPPAYNFYTQDLKNATNCEVVCFADDTNLIMSDKDPNNLIRNMNKELNKTHNYMTQNTLIINESKTYFLLFKPKGSKKQEISEKLLINHKEIMRVNSARYLGIWFDEDLKFKKQYEILINKLEETVKALIAVRTLLNYKIKLLIYHSLFQSHINYCSIAYLDKLTPGQIDTIYKLQKKAIRLIFKARINAHTSQLFKLAKIIPFNKLYDTEAIKFVFINISNTSKDKQPKAIQNILFKNEELKKATRLQEDESKVKIFHKYRRGHAIYNILNSWNKTEVKHRMAGNILSLKNLLKESTLKELESCVRPNCMICELDSNRNYESYMMKL